MLSCLESYYGTEIFSYMSISKIVATILLCPILPTNILICLGSNFSGFGINNILPNRFTDKFVIKHRNGCAGIYDTVSVAPAHHIGPAASFKPELEFLLPLDYLHCKFRCGAEDCL